MKYSKSIFQILIVFLLIAQNSFAGKPIPGVGIVVKKNPGSGAITVPTGNSGGFSTQLEEGVYELSFPQDQLQTSINGIVKSDYPKSSYQYDGSGVEMVLDNSQITVNAKASEGNLFAIDKQNSITITVPKGGATLSGKLSWNDAVMTNSISCPDGFIMQNRECVPINNAGNQQARTEGKTKGKIVKAGNNGMISVSLNANGGTSSSAGVDNSLSFNPSLGIAIHWKNFGIGLDAGTFSNKPDFDFNAYAAPLQNLDFLTITNTKSDWTSTYFMLGPQYTISLSPAQNTKAGRHTPFHNKLTFTIALKGGLTINKAPEFSVMDKSTPPKSIASYTAPQDYKKNVVSLKPSIGFDYWMSENFALTANAQYLIQTGQKEFTTGYRDLTNVNLAPPISPDLFNQNIAAAPKVMTNTKGPENYMSFGFGITYRFNKGGGDCDDASDIASDEAQRKGWDGSIKGKNTAEKGITENGLKKSDVETASNETQRKGWDGSIKGKNIAEKGINENGLKKNDVETVSDETQRKGITEGGLPKKNVETSTVNGSKAIIENPNDNSGEPGQQVYLFSNGCTRTCTGNWYANADGSVGCDGTAGPRVCINKTVTTTPSATARVRKRPDMKTQDFDQDGNPTDKKGLDGTVKGNIMENVGPEENDDNIESIHIKITITTKVGFTDCESPGYFFCIGVEIGALHNNQNLGDLSLEKDQIISKANVELMNGNIINVTSIGVKSTISEKTMSEFANKTQKNKEFTLDKNVLNEICKALNLNTPIEPVIFRAEDQKYEVFNTTNEGKEVQILEIHQKTKIKIDGKEYTLSMLTTSGKGLNRPKN